MQIKSKRKIPILFFLFFIPFIVHSQVRLPKLIADGMVLQRETPLNVWGWAAPQERVTIHFLDSAYQCVANSEGEWSIRVPPQKAGGPFRMTISASNTITLQDILIGDVWICSGQSNMELPMRRVRPLYEQEITNAENNFIRYFEVPKHYNFNEAETDLPSGQWQKTTPSQVLSFSAVAYFFAQELYNKYKVPVGLINTSLGGSPVEAWISEGALKAFPEPYQEAQKFKDSSLINRIESEDRKRIQAWYQQLARKDQGYQHPQEKWYNPAINTTQWESMDIPGYWANTAPGPINGVVWFRKELTLPASLAGQPAKMNMGRIIDADSVFVNGRFVGATGYQYPPRWYTVPAGVLQEGKNTIVVRVINERGEGGFVPDKPYTLEVKNQVFDLTGKWQYRLGASMEPLASQTFIRWKPTGLFNAMISPLLNYNMKGVIWYQGESNADNPVAYRTLFPAMIRDWRNHWQQGDFPFLFVQLANFMEARKAPAESNWALLREAQSQALALPNIGMAVAIDVGEWNDIHPLNKKEVAHRLARSAQKVAYGENTAYSGPVFESMKIDKGKVTLTFTNTAGGLVVKGKTLKHFAIAGPDKHFVWANAKIQGNQVIVWSEKVPDPVAVRYAWADNPEGANLYNKAGLPAAPFRTDFQ